jgi:GH3 auxin-responsive promoter
MIQGDKSVLWPGVMKWFAKSSGTTNAKSKFIPVSKESLDDCHFRGGKDVLAIYYRNNPGASLLSGKSLTLGGSHQMTNLSNKAYYGDLSAIMIENLPFWTDFHRTPPTEIALIPEFEEKIAQITKTAIQDNVTSLAGVPSWFLVLLRHILEYTGKSNITEVWPNLELFIHGGVSFEPYKEQYKRIIPSGNMHYMETYNASEGFFAIQDDPSGTDMLLMLDYGVFYEFILAGHTEEEHPVTIPLWKIELGVNYAMVISTNGGLWRYMIGDTVMFTSKDPYKLRITGRTKHFINAFGEEIIIDNAERAIKLACASTGAIISDYTAGPIFMTENQTKGAHQWIIEFITVPNDLDKFTIILDLELQALNSDYEAKRYKSATLERPHVLTASEGTFLQWMRERGKVGGQNKVPRLSNNREFLDELLLIHENLEQIKKCG